MHIIVKSEEANLNLRIPSFVFTNKFVFKAFISKQKELIDIPESKEDALYHILKQGVKKYKGLVLVEVESAQGEYVKITL